MNRPVKATDIVNFVMKNGEFRPLVIVRSWDRLPAAVLVSPPVEAVPRRPGEQVKFPTHNQPSQIPVTHVCGVLYIDPSVDATNIPGVLARGSTQPSTLPQSPSAATLEAQVARGKVTGASTDEVNAGNAAAQELERRRAAGAGHPAATPPAASPALHTRTAELQAQITRGNAPDATPAEIAAGKAATLELNRPPAGYPVAHLAAGAFQVWIESAVYDDHQSKEPGTWHWPKGY
jgi:hypothetical protein